MDKFKVKIEKDKIEEDKIEKYKIEKDKKKEDKKEEDKIEKDRIEKDKKKEDKIEKDKKDVVGMVESRLDRAAVCLAIVLQAYIVSALVTAILLIIFGWAISTCRH